MSEKVAFVLGDKLLTYYDALIAKCGVAAQSKTEKM